MASHAAREVILKRGRDKLTLRLKHGHVWEVRPRRASIGHPVYDLAGELALFDRLLAQHVADGFAVVRDAGLSLPTEPATPAGWRERADVAVAGWKRGDYDTAMEAILAVRALLDEAPAAETARRAQLEATLGEAIDMEAAASRPTRARVAKRRPPRKSPRRAR